MDHNFSSLIIEVRKFEKQKDVLENGKPHDGNLQPNYSQPSEFHSEDSEEESDEDEESALAGQ